MAYLTSPRNTGFLILALLNAGLAVTGNAATTAWTLIYQDDYDYASQARQGTTKFNTWMWREDCNGNHYFQDIQSEGCSPTHPCVKLTAEVYDAQQTICKASLLSAESGSTGMQTPYINAEMYNNACVRQGPGQPQPQAFDKLLTYGSGDKNPWVQKNIFGNPILPAFVLYETLRMQCDRPYPYDPAWQNAHPVTPYAKDSWNTTTPGVLQANPLAYSTTENAGMWFRDLVWNTPYLATTATAQKIVMSIKAEGDGGGSRGWGFWNTTMNPFAWQYAWFMEFTNPVSPPPAKGQPTVKKTLLAMTVTNIDLSHLNAGGICLTQLPDDIYRWRDYTIVWRGNAVEYQIDQQPVAVHTQFVPNGGMSFHNWVDNRNYSNVGPGNYPITVAKSNTIRKFEVYESGPGSAPAPVGQQCASWGSILQKAIGKNAGKPAMKKFALEIRDFKTLVKLLKQQGILRAEPMVTP
ncbi:hypothetical protein DLREEDagrD3_26920 [Denitratisoma sp. agr-D3]